MTLKAGTVCYVTGLDRHACLNGRVVTLTGRRFLSNNASAALPVWEVRPALRAKGNVIDAFHAKHLIPISDPDQPVDVTSDTDEPVTV